jgi:tetraacyldisaccharide 4'-kinase
MQCARTARMGRPARSSRRDQARAGTHGASGPLGARGRGPCIVGAMSLSGALERVWYPAQGQRTAWPARALAIPELAFRAAVSARNALYDRGALRSVRVEGAGVISVGNLTVGGSGKTPAVIHLATMLCAAGRRVFVLSRGHGRRSRSTAVFRAADAPSWEAAGDEPLLIARRCPEVTVMVGADRAALAQEAARRGAEAILLDDGFQHRRLQRDLDLLVVDGAVGFGNGRLLPRGPLREPRSSLHRAGLVWWVEPPDRTLSPPPFPVPVVRVRVLPAALVSASGREEPLGELRGRKVVALAAMARPERFASMLALLGAEVVERRFLPDHAPLELAHLAPTAGALLVTTEKDHARLPAGAPPVARLRVAVEIVDGEPALRAALGLAPG